MLFNLHKKAVALLLATSVLAGCAGRTPNPVPLSRTGDHQMSCGSLHAELEDIDHQVRQLLPKSEKTGKNVGLGIAGAFLVVPWFFMDFSDAEKIEIAAYQNRYNHISRIYNDKHCGQKIQQIHISEQIEAAQKKKTPASKS